MRGERGSVSIVAIAVVTMATVLAFGTADLARVLVAVAKAQTAADAGALAAAQELAIPSGLEPAEVAADYVARNGGALVSCACERGTFEATVRARVDSGRLLLLGGARSVEAEARAVVDVGALP